MLVRSVTTGTVLVTTTVFVNTCTTGALVHVTSCLYARSSVEHPLTHATSSARAAAISTPQKHFSGSFIYRFLSIRTERSSSRHSSRTFVLLSRQTISLAFAALCSATTPRRLSWYVFLACLWSSISR